MNILVINLTRFGDLLQSRALVHDLTARGHRVGVVCLENFAAAARLLPDVAHVAPLPGAALLRDLGAAPADRRRFSAFAVLEAWRQALVREFPYDDVRNLTATVPARLLCRLLADGRPITGFTLDAEGFALDTNPWAAFTLGSTRERGNSPFNIVDLFRRAGQDAADTRGLRSPGAADLNRPGQETRRALMDLLQAEAPTEHAGFVGLQLGASRDERRLPTGTFAAIGDRLWAEHRLCLVLFGGADERPLTERYAAKAKHPFVNLCGRTDLETLAAALTRLRLLISNDTGTLHLAAGLDVPVLGVYLATAQPFDTGPYRAGSCTVEPDLPCHPCPFRQPCPHNLACRNHIPAGTLFAAADAFLRTGAWPNGPAPGARVWLSLFDNQGFMDLRSLSGHEREGRTLRMAVQRPLLRQFLDSAPSLPFVPDPLPASLGRDGALFAGELDEAVPLAELLAAQAALLAARPSPAVRDKLLAGVRRMRGLLDGHPHLAALSFLFAQYGDARDLNELPVQLKNFHTLLVALRGNETS